MTLAQMEKAKANKVQIEIGLGHFDKNIINFIVDDEESADLKKKRLAYQNPKKKDPGNFDYLFNRTKSTKNDANVFSEFHDDTDIDMVKVMRRLQVDQDLEQAFSKAVTEKFTNFNDLRQLLEDSKLISEPIIEEGREFDPEKNQLFVPVDAIDYAMLEWKDIEHTSLGRRLTQYFD